jgi:hypothetical protein
MSLLEICQSLQDTGVSTAIRESIWGYPIVSAIHVVGLAWFGGLVLASKKLAGDLRTLKQIGLAFMLFTGLIVFASQPVRYYGSAAFRIKLLLLVLIGLNGWLLRGRSKLSAAISLLLWAAILFASRGIAFF